MYTNPLVMPPLYASFLVSVFITAQFKEPTLEIGKDTSVVEGPLTKDGLIDYAAYLNSENSKGVRPENNAAVSLLRIWPGSFVKNERFMKAYCEELGIAPPPVKGKYFVEYEPFLLDLATNRKGAPLTNLEKVSKRKEIEEKRYATSNNPWKTSQYPDISLWLDTNKVHFDKLQKASLLPDFYQPLVPANPGSDSDKYLVSCLRPQTNTLRTMAKAMRIRALMYMGKGQVEKCFEDALTIRRLGNLAAHEPGTVEKLVAIAILQIAQDLEARIGCSELASATQLLQYRQQLLKSPATINIQSCFDEYERFLLLDMAQQAMKHGFTNMIRITRNDKAPEESGVDKKLLAKLVNWSQVQRTLNTRVDAYIAVFNRKDWPEQWRLIQDANKSDKEREQMMYTKFRATTGLLQVFISRKSRSNQVANGLYSLFKSPKLRPWTIEKQCLIRDDLSGIVLALAAYKKKKGEYPKRLNMLEKEFGIKLPEDRFSNSAFKYHRKGNGFLLYSVGPNGIDENGYGKMNKREEVGDDIGAGYSTFSLPDKRLD